MSDYKPMTKEELNEIEAQYNEASRGPWHAGPHGGSVAADPTTDDCHDDIRTEEFYGGVCVCESVKDKNLDFIVSAKTNVPRLVGEVRRLRNLVREERTPPWYDFRDDITLAYTEEKVRLVQAVIDFDRSDYGEDAMTAQMLSFGMKLIDSAQIVRILQAEIEELKQRLAALAINEEHMPPSNPEE